MNQRTQMAQPPQRPIIETEADQNYQRTSHLHHSRMPRRTSRLQWNPTSLRPHGKQRHPKYHLSLICQHASLQQSSRPTRRSNLSATLKLHLRNLQQGLSQQAQPQHQQQCRPLKVSPSLPNQLSSSLQLQLQQLSLSLPEREQLPHLPQE